MRRHLVVWGIVAAVLAVWSGAAWGQASSQPASRPAEQATTQSASVAPGAEAPSDPVEEFFKKTKHPVSWFTWGADVRLREVFTPNLLLDQEDRHFQRYRERVWATVSPCADLDINTRLVYEPRHFCQPSREAFTRDAAYIDEWTMDEAIFDQMNVEWRNICGLPLKAKVGRQDIILGNGWLVLDGTPLDGSRTIFFDAVRGTLDLKNCQTSVDVIYIDQHADSDWWIKPFCDKDFHNIEQDEKGAILYVTNTSLPKTQIDGYFIYKHDEAVLNAPADYVAPWQAGDNADIYAFGARAAGDIGDHWKYRAEYAAEFGNKNGQALCAQGFNSLLSYFLKDKCNNNFRVGYEYLSGDKPGTESTNEQFDPLWGRWPQFSELLVYTVALENRPGETTNLHRVQLGWSCNPCKNLEWLNDYHLLFRDQKSYTGRPYFDQDCFRGQLFTSVLKYKFNEHVSTHLWGEFFFPGNFYSESRNETAAFLRYEVVFTW